MQRRLPAAISLVRIATKIIEKGSDQVFHPVLGCVVQRGVVVVVIAVAVAWIKDSTQLPRTLVDLELLLMFDYYCD